MGISFLAPSLKCLLCSQRCRRLLLVVTRCVWPLLSAHMVLPGEVPFRVSGSLSHWKVSWTTCRASSSIVPSLQLSLCSAHLFTLGLAYVLVWLVTPAASSATHVYCRAHRCHVHATDARTGTGHGRSTCLSGTHHGSCGRLPCELAPFPSPSWCRNWQVLPYTTWQPCWQKYSPHARHLWPSLWYRSYGLYHLLRQLQHSASDVTVTC